MMKLTEKFQQYKKTVNAQLVDVYKEVKQILVDTENQGTEGDEEAKNSSKKPVRKEIKKEGEKSEKRVSN